MQERNNKGYIKHILIGILYSIICGIITGVAIFFFKYIAKVIENLSRKIYEISSINFIYIIFVFICLIVLAIIMYYIHKKIPETKGGGIPKSEGVLRGIISFKWLRSLLGTFFGSVISYLAGLPVGTEGPSVLIGTSIGDMCSSVSKKNKALGRYVKTGGAAAGFAVATGAPFSGILFALEEIHKRFTPMLVITVTISVISATIVNVTLCNAFNVSPYLFEFGPFKQMEYKDILYLIVLALLVAISVGLFDKSIIIVKKIMNKYKFKINSLFKLIFVFIITGILGYVFQDAIYSGHHTIEETLIHNNSILILFLLLIVRFIMMHLIIDSGATGGIFIPTMAIASIIGVLLGKLLLIMGLDIPYFPTIVLLTICAFIGGTLRAPITAVILFIELTGSINNLLFAILVVFVVYFIVELFNQTSLYDQVLEKMEKEEHQGKERVIGHFEIKISENSFVVGKSVRDVMWPSSFIIMSIKREKEDIYKLDNDGERKLFAKDSIVVRCRYYDEKELIKQIQYLVGTDYEIKRVNI